MTLEQGLAIAIFLGMFLGILTGKVQRYIPALIGALLTVIIVFLGVMRSWDAVLWGLNLRQIGQAAFWLPGQEHLESHGVNWQTIIFIGGMMVMVEGLGAVGFFRWLCLHVARLMHYKVIPVLISFMFLSGFLSMFIDSITVLLFLSLVTVELGRLLRFDPVPLIIAEIFAANVGGSATMAGDPPNIIIGTALGYKFTDFLVNTGLIAWVGMLIALALFYLFFRKALAPAAPAKPGETLSYPAPAEAIRSPILFKINIAIFALTVILLITHANTGISVATVAGIAASLTLVAAGKEALRLIKGVDWRTLLFFFGLFVCVGGLERTGVLETLADYIGSAAGGSSLVVISIILWVSALASGIVDNIPFAATMVPVIRSLAQTQGFALPMLAWTLALGTDIGGNATPIGASANVVGTAIAERNGHPIGWGRFCKYAFPAMILVVALCNLLLVVRYGR
ncbi:MAG: SLC13 family permease [Candidatus Acetothermia bacterium]|jgi:Na+/H+ antiporter NhaD/arsenite permease-like protein|nr:SLC13 family permease [Candidatus Acetothermia bacterium]MDH7504527.1 SLC13 family permease [Candidatus Acetothermia bacterium]